MRTLVRLVFALTVALLPVAAFAQATIAGTVRDTSGAVAARSNGRSRQSGADREGPHRRDRQHRPVSDRQPAPRSVCRHLFAYRLQHRQARGHRADGGHDVATINGELRVGSLEETITVSGEAPIVDVQSVAAQQVMSSDTLAAVPATRGYNALVFLVPSVTGGSNQVDLSPMMRIFYSHGGRGNEGRVMVDGLSVGAALNGGGVSLYVPDTTNSQEMTMNLSGGLGEAETGGAVVNIIPKTGGNVFSGTAFTSLAGAWSQSNNIDDRLRSFGLADPPELIKNWDSSISVGGPIHKDRAWFYGTFRTFGQHDTIAGMYANKNAGDPTKWNYEKDLNVKARNAVARTIYAVRATVQATPRNKFGLYFDDQEWCDGSSMRREGEGCRLAGDDWVASGQATLAPEASSGSNGLLSAAGYHDRFTRMGQATWTSPYTNRDAVRGRHLVVHQLLGQPRATGRDPEPDSGHRAARPRRHARRADLPRAGEHHGQLAERQRVARLGVVCDRRQRDEGRLPGRVAHLQPLQSGRREPSHLPVQQRRAQPAHDVHPELEHGGPDPVSRALRAGPVVARAADAAGRSALRPCRQLGTRGGNGWGSPQPFYPVPIVFPRTDSVTGFNDITYRGGSAWNVFGDGKTSVKLNLGKYLQSANNQDRYTLNNPAQGTRFPRSTARSWNDLDRDFVPDCELMTLDRQRRMWRLADAGLRQPDCFDHQPRDLPRLGRPPLRLAIRRVDPARGAAANLARVRL